MKQDELFQAIDEEDDIDRAKVLVELYKARAQEESTKFKAWSRSFIVTVSVAALTGIIGIISSFLQHQSQINLEDRKAAHQLIRNAIQADRAASLANIRFLLDAGLIDNSLYQNQRIIEAAKRHTPRRVVVGSATPEDAELGVSFKASATILGVMEFHSDVIPDFPMQIIEIPANEDRSALYSGFVPVSSGAEGLEVRSSMLALDHFSDVAEEDLPFVRALDSICATRETKFDDATQQSYLACAPDN